MREEIDQPKERKSPMLGFGTRKIRICVTTNAVHCTVTRTANTYSAHFVFFSTLLFTFVLRQGTTIIFYVK